MAEPRSQMEADYVRFRSGMERVWGAVVGVVVGGVLGLIVANALKSPSTPTNHALAVAMADETARRLLHGLLIGAGIGAAVGFVGIRIMRRKVSAHRRTSDDPRGKFPPRRLSDDNWPTSHASGE